MNYANYGSLVERLSRVSKGFVHQLAIINWVVHEARAFINLISGCRVTGSD